MEMYGRKSTSTAQKLVLLGVSYQVLFADGLSGVRAFGTNLRIRAADEETDPIRVVMEPKGAPSAVSKPAGSGEPARGASV